MNVKSEPLIKDDDLKIDKIDKDKQRIKDLADELEQYCLPPKQGALVVVTGIKKRETLQNDNVWRGFGSLVESPISETKKNFQISEININTEQMEKIWNFMIKLWIQMFTKE